eukprot:5186282-Heterocapsa_arctica.AAC.1
MDDYPQLEPAASAPSADRFTIDVFELRGRELKKVEGRVPSFEVVVGALGGVFDLSRVPEGEPVVRDEPERVVKVIGQVRAILTAAGCSLAPSSR